MARKPQAKCIQCAHQSAEVACAKSCWDSAKCPKRRYYYKNRVELNQKHRAKRQKQVDEGGISISMKVSSKFGVLYFWKANRKDAPIHAFAAALWIDQKKVAYIEPIHFVGLTPSVAKQKIREAQLLLINHAKSLSGGKGELKFDIIENIDPASCPIRPCPLLEDF